MERAQAVSRAFPREKWPDWFLVSKEVALIVGPSPSIQFLRGEVPIVHRTHLPLILDEHPELAIDEDGTTMGVAALQWFTPRSWQISGASFIVSRRGTLLADVQRSGKTPTIIASHDRASGPLVVVGPLSARSTWLKWMRTRWPDNETVVLCGRHYERDEIMRAQTIFVNYDIISSWQSLGNREIGTLVFDEAHLLASSRKSYRSQAATFMSSKAHRVVMATGTPLWNDPAGLWTLLACLNPGAWGKYWDFAIRYAGARKGGHGFELGDPTNTEELRARLRAVMLRRTWTDILEQVPEVTRTIITLPVSENVEREIDMACLSIRQDVRRRTPVGELARLRRVVSAQKVKTAIDQACAQRERGPVVVWTWHKDAAEEIAKGCGLNVTLITGEIPQSTREHLLDNWRKRTDGVLVATMGCAQAGVDLAHAEQAIFAELDFTPAVIGQAEMRTFSPTRPMHVTYITINHRVEHALIEILRKKLHVADIVGMPAADTALDVIRTAFDVGSSGGDLERLKKAILREEDEDD